MARWLSLLVLLYCLPAFGAGWLDGQGNQVTMLKAGGIASWTEAATTDSSLLCVPKRTTCDNAGSTAFTTYRASDSGTKLNVWVGPVTAGVSCSPSDGNTTCGQVELHAGCYVFDPDATAATAICWVDQ